MTESERDEEETKPEKLKETAGDRVVALGAFAAQLVVKIFRRRASCGILKHFLQHYSALCAAVDAIIF